MAAPRALASARETSRPPRPAAPGVEERCHTWYAAYGRAVYRYLRFHVDSADTTDDLTADVFLRVLEAGERYDPARAEARTWIFAIARNALRDHLRRLRVRRHVALEALRDLATDAPSPEERLLREEEIARLLDGVRRLGAGDRELIALRYGSELAFAEIGTVLGLREQTVRTRLWRALARLRAEVVEEDG
jgi:RNA polymerase sigma factor (sigma-70 family)